MHARFAKNKVRFARVEQLCLEHLLYMISRFQNRSQKYRSSKS